MTWAEIKKKYSEERDDMTEERELEYVSDCFDAYEEDGFADTFGTPYCGEKSLVGKKFVVVGRVSQDEAELECLPMWNIQFEDGKQIAAYPEEIIKSEQIANGLVR